MIRRLAASALAAVAAGALLSAAPAQAAPVAAPAAPASAPEKVDFTGIVALSNCSGSVVRGPRSRPSDKALVLTNGHCLETGFPDAGEVIVDQPSDRTFTLLTPSGDGELGTLRATRVEYATMTDTDVAVYRLNRTYAQIRDELGGTALKLSAAHPREGAPIRVVSGYWRKIYSCDVDGFAHRLREYVWTWKDSIRYTPACDTIGGTSGSPIRHARTGKVIGVNNTGNEDGERCTLNNPCEVDRNGDVTVRQGINYGQQTYLLARCLRPGNEIVLDGRCALPRPSGS